MFNTWDLPELDAALLDSASAMNWGEMNIPDLTRLPTTDWSVEESFHVAHPSEESRFFSANAWSGKHDGHDWQENHDWGSPSNKMHFNSGNSNSQP